MVEDCIPVETDSVGLRRLTQLGEVLTGAPFSCSGTFLLELAEVVQVIDVVAVARAGAAFTAGWEPDVVDADAVEIGERFAETLPVFVV